MQLKLGELCSIQASSHNSLVQIVNAVFGGSDSKSTPPAPAKDRYNDVTAGSTSVEDAVARINRMLMIGG